MQSCTTYNILLLSPTLYTIANLSCLQILLPSLVPSALFAHVTANHAASSRSFVTTNLLRRAKAPDVRKVFLHLSHNWRKDQALVRGFLLQTQGLECLTLRGVALFAEECCRVDRLGASLEKMRMLSVSLDFTCEQHALFLIKLLECCPRLSVLNVNIGQVRNEIPLACFDGHGDRVEQLACLADHLENVQVHGFKAGSNDKELVRTFLLKAKSLKKKMLQFPNTRTEAVKDMLLSVNLPMEITSLHRKSCRFTGLLVKV